MAVCNNYRSDSLYNDFALLLIMKYKKYIPLLLIFLISIDLEAQCSMCRAVLETDADGATAEGINQGILYLMAFPYILVGIIGFFVYRSRQKAKLEEVSQS
jgi:hypothetical protein